MSASIKASESDTATLEALRQAQIDVSGAKLVDVQTDMFAGRHRLWVNINGVCVLRVCQAEEMKVVALSPTLLVRKAK
jgi:hypothetical protein